MGRRDRIQPPAKMEKNCVENLWLQIRFLGKGWALKSKCVEKTLPILFVFFSFLLSWQVEASAGCFAKALNFC